MKDNWDKAEIVGKIVVGLAVPIVVAITAAVLNNQISMRNLTGTKLQIAVGVLGQEPNEETNALRDWAIEVLRDPDGEHALSEEAAAELKRQALPSKFDMMRGWAVPWMEPIPCDDDTDPRYDATICTAIEGLKQGAMLNSWPPTPPEIERQNGDNGSETTE